MQSRNNTPDLTITEKGSILLYRRRKKETKTKLNKSNNTFETSQFASLFLVSCSPFHCAFGSWWLCFPSDGRDGGCQVVSSASGVLHQEDYDVDVDGLFFLTLGSFWGIFYMSAFTSCSFFISLQLHITSKFIVYGAFYSRSLFLVLFVAQNNWFCPAPGHLSSCTSLTGCCWIVCRPVASSDSLCPISCHPIPVLSWTAPLALTS